MIEFRSPTDFPQGTIAHILRESYGALQSDKNLDWEKFAQTFDEFDTEVLSDEYVARCTFITTENDIPIGLGSFDPRQKPAYGDIGHNCVLPEAQGKSVGKAQIMEILRQLRERGIKTARVSTGTGSFFEPARRMYESCGFKEMRTFLSDTYPYGEMIEYELPL